jgi:hypothetical protein
MSSSKVARNQSHERKKAEKKEEKKENGEHAATQIRTRRVKRTKMKVGARRVGALPGPSFRAAPERRATVLQPVGQYDV